MAEASSAAPSGSAGLNVSPDPRAVHQETPEVYGKPLQEKMRVDGPEVEDSAKLLDDEGPQKGVLTCLPGCCCSVVGTGSVGVIQQCGSYIGYQEPGCMMLCPCCHTVQVVSLKINQITCTTDCKTLDNVTLKVSTAITYQINKRRLRQAVFEIQDPEQQMRNYTDNVVRSALPSMELDQAYANKDTLCKAIHSDLAASMARYGYDILNALVTDLAPDPSVLQAMNEINAARRQRIATQEKAEAQKLLQIRAAEADAEAKFLSGQGVAKMRKAMADGVKESMECMRAAGLSNQDAMQLMITTQYIDTLKDFATNPNKSAIMVPSGPSSASDIQNQIREGFITANALSGPVQHKM